MLDDVVDSDWADGPIDQIVADLFDMLELELRGGTFVERQCNAARQQLTGRSCASAESKHHNVSVSLLLTARHES